MQIDVTACRKALFDASGWSAIQCDPVECGVTGGAEGLEWLCRTYWYPLYAYVRRQGRSAHDAQDPTQEFFAGLLRRDDLIKADPSRGKFRSFLLGAMKHFLANDRDRVMAQKRGGGETPISIDEETAEGRFRLEPADPVSPERFYDRGWAQATYDRATERLRQEWEAAGQGERFAALRQALDHARFSQAAATQLGMSEAALKSAVHRMRRRFRELLVEEVGHTVASAEEIDGEVRHLLASLGR